MQANLHEKIRLYKPCNINFLRKAKKLQRTCTGGILCEIPTESTFRCLKTDLDVRPIYHQKDVNTEAHLFIGILAYRLVHAIREELKKKDIRYDRRHIRDIMSSHTIITTRMKLENGDSLIIRRQPSCADRHAARLYSLPEF